MGYYEVDDIPFQRALADAFTICDAHHCSIQSGTFVNRLVYMSGSNFTPGMTETAQSQAQGAIDSANKRGVEFGAYDWTTYPERLQAAGVSWRIYQEDDWNGHVAPWQAFKAYREARPGSPLFNNALRNWTLGDLANHVQNGSLPQVSWIVPPPVWSEHPADSSPLQGAAYIQRILGILSSNPELWSRTVFLISFDENDGFFDHVPPPAPPSFDGDGKQCGGSTLDDSLMAGLYFKNEIAGTLAKRPYGLGPRVPMYVISPWSRGGWVCSQVFDHTSTIRFLEARFGVEEPNISAWHRSVSGDLTACFDFSRPTFVSLPQFPDVSAATGSKLVLDQLTPVTLPRTNHLPRQDSGVRRSRALPYRLALDAKANAEAQAVELTLHNDGTAGAVFHLYDKLHLDRVPHRYTVEAKKQLNVAWDVTKDRGSYELEAFGPNGFRWTISGVVPSSPEPVADPCVVLRHNAAQHSIELVAVNRGQVDCYIVTSPNVYRSDREATIELAAGGGETSISWPVSSSGFWYDFSVIAPDLPGWLRRFAGRLETGHHGITDPALGGIVRC
jgi:phospholipase C